MAGSTMPLATSSELVSDPVGVAYLRKRDGMLEELERTEVITNRFDVYDVDTKYHNVPVKTFKLKDQEFLGEASCVLSEIVTKQSRSLTLSH